MNKTVENRSEGKARQKKDTIVNALFGNPETTSLEARIFNCISLLGALTGYITIVTNYLFHLPASQQIASVGLAVSSSVLYYVGRWLKKWRAIVLPVLLFILLIIAVNWFFAEGIQGATGYYFFILSVGSLILLGEKYKTWPLLVIIAVIVILCVVSAAFPGLITSYQTKGQRTSDLFIGLIIALIVSGLMVYLMYKEFIKERAIKDRLLAEITSEKNIVEKTLQDKHRLLSAVSHDIANALTVIRASVSQEQKRNQKDARPGGMDLQRMDFAAMNIAEIIDSVRMMEAIETGKIKFTLKPVALSDIIEKARMLFADRLAEKNITLRVDAEQGRQADVLAEPKTLANNVFNNILSNAIKFSFPGSSITIATENRNGETAISVRDTGIGIPGELRQILFSPGAKTSRAGTAGETGTGFGMLVVGTFMQLYGGRIEIESKSIEEFPEEHGTTVKLILKNQ